MPSVLWIFRLVILVLALVCAAGVAAAAGIYIGGFQSFEIVVGIVNFKFRLPIWPFLAFVAAGLTFLLVVPMMIVDCVRRGAVTSWVGVELVACSILWILWVATSVLIRATSNLELLKEFGLPASCKGLDDLASYIETLEIKDPVNYDSLKAVIFDAFGQECRDETAVQGLSLAAFSLLFIYTATLLIAALVALSRGRPTRPFATPVRSLTFGGAHAASEKSVLAAAEEAKDGWVEFAFAAAEEEKDDWVAGGATVVTGVPVGATTKVVATLPATATAMAGNPPQTYAATYTTTAASAPVPVPVLGYANQVQYTALRPAQGQNGYYAPA